MNIEDRHAILLREMDHRIENLLATVQAIMATTIRSASSLQEFQASFSARLMALSKTQSLLTANKYASVPLHELLDNELSLYEDGDARRITCAGPHADIPGHIATPVGMAIHELTTNSAKYGALSALGGQLSVNWDVADDKLDLAWRERGVSDVRAPQKTGFGTQLLTRVLPLQTQAKVTLDYEAEGLTARFLIPLKSPPPETLGTDAG